MYLKPRMAAAALAALTGCAADPTDSPGGVSVCGGGTDVSLDGAAYCVYSDAIIETGFDCPPDRNYRYDFDGGVVCSEQGDRSEEQVERAAQAGGARPIDAGEDRRPLPGLDARDARASDASIPPEPADARQATDARRLDGSEGSDGALVGDAGPACDDSREGEFPVSLGDGDVYAHTAAAVGSDFAVIWAEALPDHRRHRLMFGLLTPCLGAAAWVHEVESRDGGERYSELHVAPALDGGFHILWKTTDGGYGYGTYDSDGAQRLGPDPELNRGGGRVTGFETTRDGTTILVVAPDEVSLFNLDTGERQVVDDLFREASGPDGLKTHGTGLATLLSDAANPCAWSYRPLAPALPDMPLPAVDLVGCDAPLALPPVIDGYLFGTQVLYATTRPDNPERIDIVSRAVGLTDESPALGEVTAPRPLLQDAGWVQGNGGLAVAAVDDVALVVWSGTAARAGGYNGILSSAWIDGGGDLVTLVAPLVEPAPGPFAERPTLIAAPDGSRIALLYVDRRSQLPLEPDPNTGAPWEYLAELQFRWIPKIPR